ncbi:uncharacterized protein ACO6RY_14678 [Pungitius sinensis]
MVHLEREEAEMLEEAERARRTEEEEEEEEELRTSALSVLGGEGELVELSEEEEEEEEEQDLRAAGTEEPARGRGRRSSCRWSPRWRCLLCPSSSSTPLHHVHPGALGRGAARRPGAPASVHPGTGGPPPGIPTGSPLGRG